MISRLSVFLFAVLTLSAYTASPINHNAEIGIPAGDFAGDRVSKFWVIHGCAAVGTAIHDFVTVFSQKVL